MYGENFRVPLQVLLTVDVRCNLGFCCCYLFVVLGGGGLLPETETKLAGARSRSCCFVHIKLESKVKGLRFRVFNLYQDSGCCQL